LGVIIDFEKFLIIKVTGILLQPSAYISRHFAELVLPLFLRHKDTSLWLKNLPSCSRMFKKVTQSIVNQMDPKGDLVPVHSILDHEHFKPLCLLKRKRKAMFHPSPCYKRTCYRLDDVLLPGDKSTGKAHIYQS